jgi:two-component system nitrate/nitrite response regulator NarL
MHRVSVVIAARYPVVLHGLIAILGVESDLSIVAACQDVVSCIEAVRDLAPDLALVDISLNDQSRLELLAAIKLDHLRTRVVLLSTPSDDSDMEEQIAGNAYGVIPRDAKPDFLVRTLRQAASGLLPIPRSLDGDDCAPQFSIENLSASLTERERQIMHSVCEGLSNKDIGRQLGLSESTINVELHHIYQKLTIQNRTALAALAARLSDTTFRAGGRTNTENMGT